MEDAYIAIARHCGIIKHGRPDGTPHVFDEQYVQEAEKNLPSSLFELGFKARAYVDCTEGGIHGDEWPRTVYRLEMAGGDLAASILREGADIVLTVDDSAGGFRFGVGRCRKLSDAVDAFKGWSRDVDRLAKEICRKAGLANEEGEVDSFWGAAPWETVFFGITQDGSLKQVELVMLCMKGAVALAKVHDACMVPSEDGEGVEPAVGLGESSLRELADVDAAAAWVRSEFLRADVDPWALWRSIEEEAGSAEAFALEAELRGAKRAVDEANERYAKAKAKAEAMREVAEGAPGRSPQA